MCGICGFNWPDEGLVKQMAEILTHRGPDQKGFFVDSKVSLGHTRLSIIDLSENGKQPMSNENGNIHIVYNGEIYNFKELRSELITYGHSFFSETDTEVIIHAYEQWGEKCVERFRGMFAFAIWDVNKKQLFLARDRLGVKPLFYYFNSGRFIFASEIKSILMDPLVKRHIDYQSLYFFLGYEYVPTPLTLFSGIRKLEPGHTLILRDNKININKYWDIHFSNNKYSEDYIADKIYNSLMESVKMRLISDVPIGAFLSGGIDSSSIVGFMSQLMDEPVKTFTIGYEDESYSELEYAKKVSELFGTEHKEIMIDPSSIEYFEKVLWHLDEPMTDPSTVPEYLFCKEARKYVTVCLSGAGGDEMFFGYDRFVASKFDQYYRVIPGPLRKGISGVVKRLPPQPEKKGIINVFKRFMEGSDLPIEGRHMRWQYFSNKEIEEKLYSKEFKNKVKDLNPFETINNYYSSCNLDDRLAREQNIEIKSFLVDNVMVKMDRMSMANSLEVREPFLDHVFVELCATIPGNLKLKGLTTKYIFKKSMKELLPAEIIYRKKQGFSFPIKNWLRNELKEYMVDTIGSSSIIKENFDSYYLNKLIEQHIKGTQNHSHQLWALINLSLWYSNYIETDDFKKGGK